ncbi:MAG TPA: HD domain-containing protein [Clostridiales bacterium]|nr:HD domain-containing protein [Clostridiales bacterium]HQP68867.1 HD domain-containing protein [Clostridiales bacterium]
MEDKDKLREILRISLELNGINDLDILLERILLEARRSTGADAGTIYTKEGNELQFRHAQNDTLQARLKKGDKLIYTSYTVPVNRNSIAGYVAETGESLNIVDVYDISGTEYKFDGRYDEKSGYKTSSMLTAPITSGSGEILGVVQLINKFTNMGDIIEFSQDDELFLKHFAQTSASALQKARMTRTLLMRMIQMAELRDPKETGAHVNRVAAYSVEIYERWAANKGIPKSIIDRNRDILRMAAMLHDVGKVGISDVILKKPAKLTPDEYDIMKLHTTFGSRLFSNFESDFDRMASVIAGTHHENWDGSGYPDKPKGDEIPVFGRIVAVADVYDALSCKRAYKEAWAEEDVLNEIKKLSGSKFDPEVVDAFMASLDVIRSISENYKDTE